MDVKGAVFDAHTARESVNTLQEGVQNNKEKVRQAAYKIEMVENRSLR